MLNKKSLAVALMGLGLAGSCFAASNQVTVDFTATVKAATCKFSVAGGEVTGEGNTGTKGLVEFTDVTLNQNPDKELMTFELNCGGTTPGFVPFNSVFIESDAEAADGRVATTVGDPAGAGNAEFVFYNANQTSPWTTGKIEFNELTAGTNTYTATKYVGFEMSTDPAKQPKTGTHKASVTYTATYQ